ncbi:MAG: hypothetical protein CVU89_04285 [Firmicutes bacterium HGW-Firmicutes-14]|nr:MAG: hypothetical protein CVU89_04285 [Firmicutes bacterium HGW-Firmicutes-14]
MKDDREVNAGIPENKAEYHGVHNMYAGVHDRYSGVHGDYPGVDLGEGDAEPAVAPGMRDFLEKDADPEEIKEGESTRVTTLSYDETH